MDQKEVVKKREDYCVYCGKTIEGMPILTKRGEKVCSEKCKEDDELLPF